MVTGLSQARQIYQDRTRRARELKEAGGKIIGYLDIYPVDDPAPAIDLDQSFCF